MSKIQRVEASLKAFEALLGVRLTVIDSRGSLHDSSGGALFPHGRQSHKKNPVCEAGFCGRCVEHCRHENLRRAEAGAEPFFVHRCWKGAMELVAPIWKGELCVGLLYAGIWREAGRLEPDNGASLPPEAFAAYRRMEAFDPARAELVGRALSLVNAGIVAGLERALRLDGAGSRGRRELIWDYVFTHAPANASLPGLAKSLGLSSSRAGHLVKELFGRSFESLLLDERLKRARSLLLSTDIPAGQIASMAGFPDQFSFNKLFKRVEGMPPGAFRKARSGAGRLLSGG